MISLYVSYVAGRRLELVPHVSAVRRAGTFVSYGPVVTLKIQSKVQKSQI